MDFSRSAGARRPPGASPESRQQISGCRSSNIRPRYMKLIRPAILMTRDQQRPRKPPSRRHARPLHTIRAELANLRTTVHSRSAAAVLPISSGYSMVRLEQPPSRRAERQLVRLALFMRHHPQCDSAHGSVTERRAIGAPKEFHLALRGAARDILSRMSAAE